MAEKEKDAGEETKPIEVLNYLPPKLKTWEERITYVPHKRAD